MSSCKPKVPFYQISVTEIRNMIEKNSDSLYYQTRGMELFWLDKNIAIETAIFLDSKINSQFYTSEYGIHLSDSLIANKLIKYLQNLDLTTSRKNYPSYYEERNLFQALLNQDNSFTKTILNASLRQWNDTAKTLIHIRNSTQDMRGFMYFVFCRILYIHEILKINKSAINITIDSITINNALHEINYTFESLKLTHDSHSPHLITTIQLKTECQSLFDIKISELKYIKYKMTKFEPKHGAQFLAILDKTKAIIRLHDDLCSEQYLIELINSKQIRIYLLESTIS